MRTREEQIRDLAAAIYDGPSKKEHSFQEIEHAFKEAEVYISEAEERARAECAADTRRLEWLGKQDVVIGVFGTDKWKEVLLARYQRSQPADLADIRITIDAAMEGGNG